MQGVWVLLVAAVTFGICLVLDKGFTRIFRSRKQHKSGMEVRLNKRYGAMGLIVGVLGIAAIFTGHPVLIGGGTLLVLMGTALVIYYMTFGVFYDEESFVLTTFGRKSKTYDFRQIQNQQLYNSYGNIVIELILADGRSFQLQTNMTGVYPFLDTAFLGWCRQKGLKKEDCPFYDPDNSCWFPALEG